MWADRRYIDLVGIDHPIIQAPMAGSNRGAMVIAVSRAGGLGSLPCAMLNVEQARVELNVIRQQTDRPYNANFFCHQPPAPDEQCESRWRKRLAAYYAEVGVDASTAAGGGRAPFDADMCRLMVDARPRVVSFQFGLPSCDHMEQLKAAGCVLQASATTVEEARWLEARGADVIIAQGLEAGGHRGMFLSDDIASQVGILALVPQVVDAVRVPVVAAGGIADARGIVAALALGASAVQIGTAYLLSPEATISAPYRAALRSARDDSTMVTNVMSGRPARGILNRLMREIGPISADVPAFPLASNAIQQLRTKAEAQGSGDFSPLWSGQAVALGRELGAGELTVALATEAQALLQRLVG
jgi:nitronate monooxygenase